MFPRSYNLLHAHIHTTQTCSSQNKKKITTIVAKKLYDIIFCFEFQRCCCAHYCYCFEFACHHLCSVCIVVIVVFATSMGLWELQLIRKSKIAFFSGPNDTKCDYKCEWLASYFYSVMYTNSPGLVK